MADARRRELERRALGGDLQADARLLAARLQAGELDPTRLRAAAHLGDTAARRVLGAEGLPEPSEELLADHLIELESYGQYTQLQALLALCKIVLPRFELGDGDDPAPRALVEALEQWLSCPCEAHEAALVAAEERASEATREDLQQPLTLRLAEDLAPARVIERCSRACRYVESGDAYGPYVRDAVRLAGLAGLREDRLRDAIRDALVPDLLE